MPFVKEGAASGRRGKLLGGGGMLAFDVEGRGDAAAVARSLLIPLRARGGDSPLPLEVLARGPGIGAAGDGCALLVCACANLLPLKPASTISFCRCKAPLSTDIPGVVDGEA